MDRMGAFRQGRISALQPGYNSSAWQRIVRVLMDSCPVEPSREPSSSRVVFVETRESPARQAALPALKSSVAESVVPMRWRYRIAKASRRHSSLTSTTTACWTSSRACACRQQRRGLAGRARRFPLGRFRAGRLVLFATGERPSPTRGPGLRRARKLGVGARACSAQGRSVCMRWQLTSPVAPAGARSGRSRVSALRQATWRLRTRRRTRIDLWLAQETRAGNASPCASTDRTAVP
jgi:hypothetical protein